MAAILVTGGTGTLGRPVVRLLHGRGHDIRVLTRHPRTREDGLRYVAGDLASGTGIDDAVTGAEVIVHCAGSPKGDERKAEHLVRAARGLPAPPHLLCVSVAGADRVPVTSAIDRALFGYFPMKAATERVITGSGLPWTILRATQFYDLVLKVCAGLAKPPLALVPAGRFQPIDTGEVARRMVELASAEPAGLVDEIGGPHVYELQDLLRGYLRASGKRRIVVPIALPGKAARAARAGAIIVRGPAYGRRTWEEFLAERTSRSRQGVTA